MIRNLKIAMLAAMTLTALGTTAVPGAQAAEFHCAAEPCTFTAQPDETAGTKTAHHVLILRNATGESNSITCDQITGHGTSATKTFTTATLTGIAYDNCWFVGQTTTVRMNGCVYQVTSHGAAAVVCPEGKKIEWEVLGCKVEVGPQALTGITFTNTGTSGLNTRVTVSTSVKGVAAKMTGTKAGCGGVEPKHDVIGEYATGNTIVRAETDAPNPVLMDGWWA